MCISKAEPSVTATQKMQTYARLWAIHRILYFNPGGWGAGSGLADNFKFMEGLSLIATFLTGKFMIPSIFLHFFINFYVKLPFVWDSEYLCMLTDMAYMSFTIYHFMFTTTKDKEAYDERRWTDIKLAIKFIMPLFYFSAGFLKVNTSFMKPETSCAPIFLAQILTFYVPKEILDKFPTEFILRTAPHVTLVVEHLIPTLWLVGISGYASALALLFHGLIALCPPPHNIGAFSICCAARIYVYHDEVVTKALKTWFEKMMKPKTVIFTTIAGYVTYQAYLLGDTFPGGDKSLPSYIAIVFLFLAATSFTPSKTTKEEEGSKLSTLGTKVIHGMVMFFTIMYTFVMPTLGLMDQGTANMFANLKVRGGTNHFVLPMGVYSPMISGGAYVRVEDASPTFAPELPGELTPHFTSGCIELLQANGHTGRVFNPVVGSIVGRFVVPQGQKFTPYTIPIIELQRFYHKALEEGVDFAVTYSILDGFYGDETWRQTSSAKRIRATVENGTDAQCMVQVAPEDWEECGEEDLLDPPHPWLSKFVSHLAYPILEGEWDELHCFGP